MTDATHKLNESKGSGDGASEANLSGEHSARYQIDHDLAQRGWGGVPSYLCALVGVGYVGGGYQSHPGLMAIATGIFGALGIGRLALILSVKRTQHASRSNWRILFVAMMLGSALSWSVLTSYLAVESTTSLAFLGASVCLLTMGGLGSAAAAPLLWLSRSYTLCLYAPLSLTLLSSTDEHGYVLGVAVACTVPFVWVLVQHMHNDFRRGMIVNQALRDRQAQLVQARQRAEDSERIQERFFATISHEMRNPLNGILGMTDCLLESDLSAEQRRQAVIISRGGDQLLAVINDVLDLSKAKHGGIQLESMPINPSDVVGEAVAMLGHEATKKGLSIRFNPQALKVTGFGDPLRLRQICLNLLSNAIKFTEKGSITVRLLQTVRQPESTEGLRISVTDTGLGMTPEAQSKIFNPYEQAEVETTRQFGGTGLGLSIVAQLVGLMYGEVAVESELGEGTSFHIDIPFMTCAEPTVVDLTRLEEAVAQAVSQLDLRVLVAEDSPVNQLVIKKMLGRLGCTVEVVANGEQALQLVRSGSFDLILMDLQMPKMDGCEATRRIRELETGDKRVPIVALTGSEWGMQACFEAGMDGYLAKPIRAEGLVKILKLHGRSAAA